jgi:hypothetical protein
VVHYPAMSFRAHFDAAPPEYIDPDGSLPGPVKLRAATPQLRLSRAVVCFRPAVLGGGL